MKYFSDILNGNEPLTQEQADAIKPAAEAILAVSVALEKIDPRTIFALSQLASLRENPLRNHIGQICLNICLVNISILKLREEAILRSIG